MLKKVKKVPWLTPHNHSLWKHAPAHAFQCCVSQHLCIIGEQNFWPCGDVNEWIRETCADARLLWLVPSQTKLCREIMCWLETMLCLGWNDALTGNDASAETALWLKRCFVGNDASAGTMLWLKRCFLQNDAFCKTMLWKRCRNDDPRTPGYLVPVIAPCIYGES